ncbi:PfkB domain-containing protein [Forsythia ovata]|uniref:PfkB domain-containing protein n=1 Tax=Forsythia ovata TaxID=205694 RepID=A0ABD1RI66_9LAMI
MTHFFSVAKLRAKGIGILSGRLLLGTAEKIPPSELVDTTGAGYTFIGAILYAICTNMPSEKMLSFAAQVYLNSKLIYRGSIGRPVLAVEPWELEMVFHAAVITA